MITVSVTYPSSEGATFDWNYYQRSHLPMIGRHFVPFGLIMASVFRGVQAVDGGAPQFVAMCLLTFSDEQAAHNALKSEGGRELMDDVAKFTNIRPAVQFSAPID